MISYFRNPELKEIAIKLLILQFLFSIGMFLFISSEMNVLNKRIINQNSTIVGQILSRHPELEQDIIRYVTSYPSREDVELGKKVLKQYGYSESIAVSAQPVFRNFYHSFQLRGFTLITLYLIPLFGLIFYEYRKLFGKVKNISLAAESVIDGDYSTLLPEDREGEFGILGHNFNTMANRLKLSLERLKDEKIFLKNIISDISHQLKTPLSSLVAMNELLLEGRVKEELKEDFLEKSRTQLNRMEWLIINLLKMARLEAGAIEFRREKLPLLAPVQRAVYALRDKAEAKEQKIITEGSLESACFTGDEEWTAEALINIIKNCIEHTGSGGEIRISLEETPIFSRILIQDNGEGIDKKDIPRIFERFYQGSNAVKTESVGIGLALSKAILEGQGGVISVQSEKGKGTKFTITFLKGII
jgi:signal transduction histidine kinase